MDTCTSRFTVHGGEAGQSGEWGGGGGGGGDCMGVAWNWDSYPRQQRRLVPLKKNPFRSS